MMRFRSEDTDPGSAGVERDPVRTIARCALGGALLVAGTGHLTTQHPPPSSPTTAASTRSDMTPPGCSDRGPTTSVSPACCQSPGGWARAGRMDP